QWQTTCYDRQATPAPPSETGCRRRAEAGPSPPLRLALAGRRRQTAATRQAHRHHQEAAAAMTGVALTIFSNPDPATGDHEICILQSLYKAAYLRHPIVLWATGDERNYAWLYWHLLALFEERSWHRQLVGSGQPDLGGWRMSQGLTLPNAADFCP